METWFWCLKVSTRAVGFYDTSIKMLKSYTVTHIFVWVTENHHVIFDTPKSSQALIDPILTLSDQNSLTVWVILGNYASAIEFPDSSRYF